MPGDDRQAIVVRSDHVTLYGGAKTVGGERGRSPDGEQG